MRAAAIRPVRELCPSVPLFLRMSSEGSPGMKAGKWPGEEMAIAAGN